MLRENMGKEKEEVYTKGDKKRTEVYIKQAHIHKRRLQVSWIATTSVTLNSVT